ncbi:hypothetical protein SBRCBS47491_001697 [Sporothrix bragantina]|uniref:Sh3 domain containing protein n=1 Tax=Sporothrix bragantina TaxID=671064 RepID=A0ABP0B0V3_9PEZI
MGVDAEELIVRPFREVVERGNEAVSNAEAAEAENDGEVDAETLVEMIKAGRGVVREGERALKRLQPVWDGQVEKYGDAFKDAMLQQDDIERRRRELEDLLYDFEDYTEPASFDPAKFAELQAATRSFALDVINHTKRLKLESPKRASTAAQLAAIVSGQSASSAAQNSNNGGGGGSSSSKTNSFPPLPPLPANMSGIPPMPPMPNLASLPAINGSERRSRSSLMKNGAGTVNIPRSSSLVSTSAMSSIPQHTTTADIMDGDDQLFEATSSRGLASPTTTEAPSLHSMPSTRASASHSSLRRASTKSSVATSMSGASSRGALVFDHAERYQLYDHPEGQDQRLSGQDEGDGVSTGPGTHPTPPPSVPRTSAWVRNHQQQLHQLQQLQNLQQYQQQHPQHSQRLRAKASRDTVATVATDYSSGSAAYDSPMMLSRFNSLTVDGSVRSATTATTAATASTANTVYSTAPSPILTDNNTSRTSYLSSAAPSYASSPVMTFATPPLPSADNSKYSQNGTNGNHNNNSSAPAPFIAPPIAALPPPAMGSSHAPSQSIQSSQSIQDFIKFAPSPPVPPISLPLSPRHKPRRPRSDDEDILDGDDGGEPIMMDSEIEELEERTHQRPGSRMGSSGHQQSTRLDWKPRMRESTEGTNSDRAERGERGERPASRQTRRPLTPEEPSARSGVLPSGMASPNLPPSVPSGLSEKHYDHGLMVVGDEDKLAKTTSRAGTVVGDDSATVDTATTDLPLTREFVREADCSIGPKSTFETMGGFCKGAELFRTGGHWTGIKQQGGYVANKQASIGRCVGCGYAHNYDEVRLDMDKKPEATFTKAGGARFRLRLLYKSHICNTINSQRQAESHYACIFCVHSGATVREGDATVFTTPDHLLLHLARHPQPLPIVPGVTVVYGNERGANGTAGGGNSSSGMSSVSTSTDPIDANDFDLHLVNPPLPTPVPPTVGQAAVATAFREHIHRYGGKKLARPPNYGGDMLHFLTGARIVGIMFPEKWEGKWCMGWHDGFVGAFPAKFVQIEPPRQNEIPMASSDSGMSVTARWKWKPNERREKSKEKDGGKTKKSGDSSSSMMTGDDAASVWLSFEKGETISNVKCLYADHWCWAGTNSKGRFGVFPQSHIITKTLQQETLAPLRPVKTGWSTKGLFKGGGGSARRPPSSSAASSMSNSTGKTRYT